MRSLGVIFLADVVGAPLSLDHRRAGVLHSGLLLPELIHAPPRRLLADAGLHDSCRAVSLCAAAGYIHGPLHSFIHSFIHSWIHRDAREVRD